MKRLIALLATTAALGVAAQPFPMKPDFERGLGVSADTAAKMESIIAKEREQRLAMHEKTRGEIAKLLTPEQLAKFDAAHQRRGPGAGGPGGPGGAGMMGPHHGMGPGMGMGGPGMRGDCPAWDAKPQPKPAA